MKACFDCDSDVILTNVIHRKMATVIHTLSKPQITETFYEKIVEYTCRMCSQKYYVTVGYCIVHEEE